jgi:hypothetical protein
MVDFGISGVEPLGSATTVLVSKLGHREIGCEDGRYMELAQDRVQWEAFVLSVEPLGSAATVLVIWILGRQVVRMGGGWNWLRIVSTGRLWY